MVNGKIYFFEINLREDEYIWKVEDKRGELL
jgi:hypothetical protein